ncbi:hypothetical protein IQ273_26335 [Nodosilinea sp. LEGE 07298]|uniref:hypothetical protein n=1 Tax=Nodosilinea sp. LEGE 07298 TaxID=2777970 RepID=UPI0018802913|nr:hypothetical protein [Nodosilinea sp. LEGE 07298]MBE9112910.1 hypothetical protein [Nodosilinea sp. LEGE 07298]
MSRNFAEVTATLAQVSEAPSLTPTMDQIPFGEIGFIAIACLWTVQFILKRSEKQNADSWAMLQRLLESQQKTSETLARTNAELVLRLARVHERLERIERVLLDSGKVK